MFSFDILRGKLVRDWPKFDPLAHAFRLTAVVIEGLFSSITISVKQTPKCMQMFAIYSNLRLHFLSWAKGGKFHTNSHWQAAKQRHAQRYTDIHSLTKINNSWEQLIRKLNIWKLPYILKSRDVGEGSYWDDLFFIYFFNQSGNKRKWIQRICIARITYCRIRQIVTFSKTQLVWWHDACRSSMDVTSPPPLTNPSYTPEDSSISQDAYRIFRK